MLQFILVIYKNIDCSNIPQLITLLLILWWQTSNGKPTNNKDKDNGKDKDKNNDNKNDKISGSEFLDLLNKNSKLKDKD